MKKILVVLPCNKGAFIGDYWSRSNWRIVGNRLIEYRSLVDYAAVESIRALVIQDGLGLVHETENEIVKGYDLYPAWRKFDPKKHGTEKLDLLAQGIVRSLDVWHSHYAHIFALLSPRAYKICFTKAVYDSGLQVKTTILDIGESPAYYNVGAVQLLEIFKDGISGKELPSGLIKMPGHEKYFKSAHGAYRRDDNFPKEYRVWKSR